MSNVWNQPRRCVECKKPSVQTKCSKCKQKTGRYNPPAGKWCQAWCRRATTSGMCHQCRSVRRALVATFGNDPAID